MAVDPAPRPTTLPGVLVKSNAERWAGMVDRLWRQYAEQFEVQRGGCRWECRLCYAAGIHTDPVAAIRDHLATAHGTVTTTTVSTDVRDTIWRGVR